MCLDVGESRATSIPVILVPDLVLPRAEAAPRENVLALEVRQDLGEGAVALEAGRRVPVVEPPDVRAHDLVPRREQLRADQPPDAVLQQGPVLDRLVARLGHLEHDGPVGPGARRGVVGGRPAAGQPLRGQELLRPGLVEGGVVGEDGRPVERAVVLDKVQLREQHISG